jgi:serine/threonine-protein kinase
MAQSGTEWTGQTLAQGRYLVRAKLGEGGMGFVYRALDQNLDADVVIKVPRRAMLDDPEFADRFAREVRSLVKLAHPCIVKVTDVGEHDGLPYAVMQYLSGGSLEDYRVSAGGVESKAANLAELGDWLPGIAGSLDFVHSQGYVHRDVKPGNILFDAHGHVFLSDFGVAKALAAGPDAQHGRHTAVTGAGMVLGTPEYMAPELIMGERFDGRIDQYALAVTVYEMLAGRRPFEGTSPTAIMVMQTTQDAPPLCEVEKRVPKAVSDAVAKALSKDPKGRFPSCAAFADAVVAAASAVPVAPGTVKSPSGSLLRPDQLRLQCPVCRKNLVLPASLLKDSEKARGKRMKCPSCETRIQFSEDSRTLVAAATGVGMPPVEQFAAGTRKVVAPRGEAAEVPPPASLAPTPARTVIAGAARLAAGGPIIDPLLDGPVSGTPTNTPNALPPWALPAAVAAGLLVLSVIAAVIVVPALSPPRLGTVRIDTSRVSKGALVDVDGKLLEPAQLAGPIPLPPGKHELFVSCPGYEPLRQSFVVATGENPAIRPAMRPLEPAEKPAQPKATEKVVSASDSDSAPAHERRPEPSPSPPPAPGRVLSPVGRTPKVAAVTRPRPKPGPTRATFKPVESGRPIENEPLSKLMALPADFSDRVFVPTGLFVFCHNATEHPDGTITVKVARVKLHMKVTPPPKLWVPTQAEKSEVVHLDPDLSRHLAQVGAIRVQRFAPAGGEQWSEVPAVFTFHVQRRTDVAGEVWVPVMKEVEFLVSMNYRRVGKKLYHDSFVTVVVTPTIPKQGGISSRTGWADRLEEHYLSQVRKLVSYETNQRFNMEMAAVSQAYGRAIDSVTRGSYDPARALEGQLRARVLGP